MIPTRRRLLKLMAASGLASALPRVGFAATGGDTRLVVILLRGALDGLQAVPALGDPDFRTARGVLASDEFVRAALPLNDLFALHGSLQHLHSLYATRELLIFHAAATPYRDRSHFDAQDLIENGTPAPHGARDGWLNRALLSLPAARGRSLAYAFGQNVPLILRGPAHVNTWAPSRLPDIDGDLVARLSRLYAEDDLLSSRLQEAIAADSLASGSDAGTLAGGGRGQQAAFMATLEAAAKFLAAEDGPRIAVMDSNGWDTHANEEAGLAVRLRGLDAGLAALHAGLKETWARTAILVVTEFGRTVAVNGSRGTDHGTAGAAFLLGGAVAGGRVIADWPGLKVADRHEGRDLKPTLDLRSVFKGVLAEGFGMDYGALTEVVFPDSRSAAPQPGLLRI